MIPEATNGTGAVREAVVGALREVLDPEIGLDVVTLGLIYDVSVDGEAVVVTYTLTTPGCPLSDYMKRAIQHAAESAAADRAVVTRLVFEPRWTPERIEEMSW